MIQISNLSKKYGETVVFSDLNYTFENACIYGLVGRNGAGKTTLLNILSNYEKNYTGVISIDRKKMNKVWMPIQSIIIFTAKNRLQRLLYILPFYICNTARPVPRPRRHRRGPPRSLQGAKAPYIWPASFCNTSRQSCSHGFQRLSPVPLDGAAGHSHHRADLAVRQFQDTMQYQDALSRLGQAGKGSGHQPVADLKLTAIGRKYKTVAGVLIYRA